MLSIKHFLFLYLLLISFTSIAQEKTLGLGIGGGAMQSYGDADNDLSFQPAFQAEVEINLNKRVNLITDFHAGKMVNGNYDISVVTQPFYARYFVTNISGVSTVVTYNLFELDKNATSWNQAFKSLYVGVGIGVEKVNVLSIRTDATLANGEKYLFAIRESPYVQVAIPVVAGFNYYIPQSPLAVGIKGQLGIIPQDELEGYATNINGKPDFYALGSISLKYYFKKANRHNSNKGF